MSDAQGGCGRGAAAGAGGSLGPAGCWAAHKRLESWARAARERTATLATGTTSSTDSLGEEFNVSKEPHCVQPDLLRGAESSRALLAHQPHPRLTRTPSVSSQSSLDSGASRTTGHRGSSPQIRTFAPDGRSTFEACDGFAGRAHPPHPPRSPSPLRAASLDARCAPPPPGAPPSARASLASLASLPPSGAEGGAPAPRCLSPLLIPPRMDRSNSLVESYSPLPPPSPGACSATSTSAGSTTSTLGALQPDLYTKKEGPLFLSAADGDSGPALAHDLAGGDREGFNDPYVRVSMIPEVDTRSRQTAVLRNDPNPFFDQHFKFPVSHDDLNDKILLLQVFDYDRYSRNEVTGEVRVELANLEVAGGVEVWGEIGRHRRPPEELQELLISLSYLPSAERLTVVVLKARNLLPPQDGKETLDPYVKVYLVVSGKRVKKKKTAIRKDTTNPVWNEAVSFSLPSSSLPNAAIEVCVLSGSSNNPAVGWCCVGATERAQEGRHWAQMSQQPRKAIAMWHTLR